MTSADTGASVETKRRSEGTRRRIELVAAPIGMQPGGYVAKAYAYRDGAAVTPSIDLEVAKLAGLWRVRLRWPCPEPVRDVQGDPSLFPDAAALLVPRVEGAPWVTMGAPGLGVEGVLWRADGAPLRSVRAEGLGTMERGDPPAGWSARGIFDSGAWSLDFTLRGWSALDAQRQLAVAIWRGSAQDRGGLKSVTPGWVEVMA